MTAPQPAHRCVDQLRERIALEVARTNISFATLDEAVFIKHVDARKTADAILSHLEHYASTLQERLDTAFGLLLKRYDDHESYCAICDGGIESFGDESPGCDKSCIGRKLRSILDAPDTGRQA